MKETPRIKQLSSIDLIYVCVKWKRHHSLVFLSQTPWSGHKTSLSPRSLVWESVLSEDHEKPVCVMTCRGSGTYLAWFNPFRRVLPLGYSCLGEWCVGQGDLSFRCRNLPLLNSLNHLEGPTCRIFIIQSFHFIIPFTIDLWDWKYFSKSC
jgi:hypothetical protein